jgi:hypothetical protein
MMDLVSGLLVGVMAGGVLGAWWASRAMGEHVCEMAGRLRDCEQALARARSQVNGYSTMWDD